MTHLYKEEDEDYSIICLKYLLFIFNFLFWMGGAAVMAVGIWTILEKSDFLSLLASSTFIVSAFILLFAGGLVMITGFLGCCAVIREQRSCLSTYFSMLLLIFLIELVAGILAYVYYHKLKCCGSNSSADWLNSTYIRSTLDRVVPDSCCKTTTVKCGSRNHPSNIYKVEGGCITKLETFLADHLLIIGAVGIGVACLQVIGGGLTTCFLYVLYKEDEEDTYSVM
ncbi:tetraspanin-11-like isoform X4 [Ambystoma mexicanum]|uniref:tetraspanin-11-like isoform X4 n=1 Tax=Ambystoma mexicanum TaxID=8296 RepID=UPI0037E70880